GVHDPHACEQSGKLDPAICNVSGPLLFIIGFGPLDLSQYELGFAGNPSLLFG
ncbi:hypothetical protein CCACVL1_24640, partial [Corchorus capsularis]